MMPPRHFEDLLGYEIARPAPKPRSWPSTPAPNVLAVFSAPQRAFRPFRATLAGFAGRLATWWKALKPDERQVYLKWGLLLVIPSLGIPWFGVVIGTGLGVMVGIFRALAGF